VVNVSKVGIVGALLITLDCYRDSGGFFLETYQRGRYKEFGVVGEFVQDNRSRSKKNVLRGMHYQITHPQGHLVYVTSGTAFDVGLDLRKDSPTFKHWIGVTLSSEGQQ
jgi:dTDP-4-dehydrorhamnose 3,5-epimerase